MCPDTNLCAGEAVDTLSPELAAEEAVFASRLQRIETRGRLAAEAVRERATEVLTEIDAAITARFVSEVDAVRSLVAAIKAKIETASKISSELRLVSGAAVGDAGVLAMPPPQPPAPEPPREAPSAERFTVAQLQRLYAVLRAAAPDNLVPGAELGLVLARVAAAAAETLSMPTAYVSMSETKLLGLAAAFTSGLGFADIRRLLVELAFDGEAPASVEVLSAARAALGDVSSREAAAAYGWWFVRSVDPTVYDRGAALRDFLLGTHHGMMPIFELTRCRCVCAAVGRQSGCGG
jgi:hypothetical protein